MVYISEIEVEFSTSFAGFSTVYKRNVVVVEGTCNIDTAKINHNTHHY